MTTQEGVDAIHRATKEEWAMTVWYRSPMGREIRREYSEIDVLTAIASKYEPDAIPIASVIKQIHVGHTPLPEDVDNSWKGGIGS